ncbi:hypothetical protein Pmar_PMAR002877 [Perkinsus marinus ATCC 50983]|uniref:Uncharacterized protein n=1 Tax=Perkinsus marinus (strain ATCC 50983 / TXsc) TaxID=423536 RepID=C5LQS5_PERM5|nr:hypothetical protein Pmar_PMAR002877 [Perkinsus marinus ATCC 50983]EER00810.1 hypothetical protein Pmar_PMAR002877 [Perkinsus marinus ATCC 50983]|eukprot:XP_002768092.1 hypothetical protein Pmar_PMAR002877 [Perkinsus marinus ATCC 50983]
MVTLSDRLSGKSKEPAVDIVVDSAAGGWKPTLEGVKEEEEEADSAYSDLNEFSLTIPPSVVVDDDHMSFHNADGKVGDNNAAAVKAASSSLSARNRIRRRQGSVMPDDGPRRQTELCRSIANWLAAAANNRKLRRSDVQIVGPVVSDIARHFVQLWNHIKTDKHKQQNKVQYLQVTGEERSKHDRTARLKKNLKRKLKRIQEFDVRKHLGGADLLQLDRARAMSQENATSAGNKIPEPPGDIPAASPMEGESGHVVVDEKQTEAQTSDADRSRRRPPRHDGYGDRMDVPKKESRPVFSRGNTTGMAISIDVLNQIEQVSALSPQRREGEHVADISPRKKNLSAKPRFFGRARTHGPTIPADAPVPRRAAEYGGAGRGIAHLESRTAKILYLDELSG